jgi:hypothetical protein
MSVINDLERDERADKKDAKIGQDTWSMSKPPVPDVPLPLLESIAVQNPAELMASAGGANEAGDRSERQGHAQVVCGLGEGTGREKGDGRRQPREKGEGGTEGGMHSDTWKER